MKAVRFALPGLLLLVAPFANGDNTPPRLLPIFPEKPGLTELDDQLYPLGWSKDGNHLAVLIERFNEAADEQRWNLDILDLRTDEAVAQKEYFVEDGTSLDKFWAQHGSAIQALLTQHKIQRSAFPLQHFPGLTGRLRGEVLELSVTSESGKEPHFGYTGVRSTQLKLTRNLTDTKTVFSKTWKEFYPLAIAAVGYLANSSHDRIAIIVATTQRGYEGAPHVRRLSIVGAGIGEKF